MATRRPTSYVEESLDEAYASRAHYHAAAWQVDAWATNHTAPNGELATVTDNVANLTGHRPPASANCYDQSQQ